MKKPPAWMKSINRFPGKMTGAASGDIACCHRLAEEAWKDYDRGGNSGLTAFAYLWRRFGPTPHGSDDHKEICCYYLGTPMPGVVLWVSPRGSGVDAGYLVDMATHKRCDKLRLDWWRKFDRVGYGIAKQLGVKLPLEIGSNDYDAVWKKAEAKIGKHPRLAPTFKAGGWKKGCPAVRAVNQALLAAMRELLRPVYVRDVPINLFGRYEGGEMHAADPHPLSGYGVPVEVMMKTAKEK